jgi:hypothetical protein
MEIKDVYAKDSFLELCGSVQELLLIKMGDDVLSDIKRVPTWALITNGQSMAVTATVVDKDQMAKPVGDLVKDGYAIVFLDDASNWYRDTFFGALGNSNNFETQGKTKLRLGNGESSCY